MNRRLLSLITMMVIAYLLLPSLIILPISFGEKSYIEFPPSSWTGAWYSALLQDLNYRSAFLNSLRIAIPSAAIATTFGTLAAISYVRGDFFGKELFRAVCVAPLMLPQIVYALGAYSVMVDLRLIGSYTAVVIGHAVIAFPVVFITVVASLRSHRQPLEQAAMTLGANFLQTTYFVTLPSIKGGIIAGFLISIALSFDDLIVVLFLANSLTRTVPLLLWESMRFELTPLAAAAASVILFVTLLILGSAALTQEKS